MRPIICFTLLSVLVAACSQTEHQVSAGNTNGAATADTAATHANTTPGPTQQQKQQYDRMVQQSLDSMRTLMKTVDSHKMEPGDFQKWKIEEARLENRIEQVQQAEDKLRATEYENWQHVKIQSDTALYNLRHDLDQTLNTMNIK